MRSFHRLSLLAALLWVAACSTSSTPESASSAPKPSQATEKLDDFDPLPLSFDWAMEERFPSDLDGDRVRDFRYDDAYLHPTSFDVTLDGCPQADKGYTYLWTVQGHRIPRDTWQVTFLDRGCRFTTTFPGEGNYSVSLTINFGSQSKTYTQSPTLKDWLVVGLGDSYGSGEGNPDIPADYSQGQGPKWADARCHRSFKAASALVAQRLEEKDRHTSVTYVSLACSGGTISRNSYQMKSPKLTDPAAYTLLEGTGVTPSGTVIVTPGSGVLGRYVGIEPPDSNPLGPWSAEEMLPPQVSRLKELVGDRPIDALVLSAGGNDVGFGDVLAHCTVLDDCHRFYDGSRLEGYTTRRFNELPGRFDTLSDELYRLFPNTKNIYLTEYPDLSRDAAGQTCTRLLHDVADSAAAPGILRSEGEIQWIQSNFLQPLNQQLRASVQRSQQLGRPWHYVGGIESTFRNHGMCAGNDRWFRTPPDSVDAQGPEGKKTETKGMAHPNEVGHQVTAGRIYSNLVKTLEAHPYYPDGTLLRDSTSQAVYVIQGFARFPVPDSELGWLLAKLGKTSADIRNVHSARLDEIPTTPRDGTLLVLPSTLVGLVAGGAVFPINTLAEYQWLLNAMHVDGDIAGYVPSQAFDGLPRVPRDGTVVQRARDIYYIHRALALYVTTMEQAYALGITDENVNHVPSDGLSHLLYPRAEFNSHLRLHPTDGSVLYTGNTASVMYGGAAFPIVSLGDLDAIRQAQGRPNNPTHSIPGGPYALLPTKPHSSLLVQEVSGSHFKAVIHGGKAFRIDSLTDYWGIRTYTVPANPTLRPVPSGLMNNPNLLGPPLNHTLLREWDADEVYLMLAGVKYHMLTEPEMRRIGVDPNRVGLVPHAALSIYPTGGVRLSGFIDEISPQARVRGWGLDLDSASNTARIEYYLDGPKDVGARGGALFTQMDRPDVNAYFRDHQAAGTHGFSFSLPYAYLNGVPHTLYVYVKDVQGDQQLILGPVSFQLGGGEYNSRFFPMRSNGDAAYDLVTRSPVGQFKALLSNGTSLASPGGVLAWTDFADTNINDASAPLRFFVMDYDGDGKDDLLYRAPQGDLMMLRSTGSGFSEVGKIAQTRYPDVEGWGSGNRFFVMDVNGDGLKDLVTRDPQGTFTWLRSTGNSLVDDGVIASTNLDDATGWNAPNRFFAMDYNGDGKDDLVYRAADGTFRALRSTGSQLSPEGPLAQLGHSDASGWGIGNRFFALDIDGDGDDDLVVRDPQGTWTLLRADPTQLTSAGVLLNTPSMSDSEGWNTPNRYFVMDYNGDGKMDLVGRKGDGTLVALRSNGVTLSWVDALGTTGYPDTDN